MNNGAKKGGSTATFETLAKTPGLEALWQLHFSNEAGMHNMAEEYIANPMGQNDAANYLKLIVKPKRQFLCLQFPHQGYEGLRSTLRLAGDPFDTAEQEDVG